MAIPFVREIDFEYGKVEQVSPLIRRVIANNPGPFTFVGTGVYIIGRGEVAVIDPGPHDEAHFEALKAALKGETVKYWAQRTMLASLQMKWSVTAMSSLVRIGHWKLSKLRGTHAAISASFLKKRMPA